jgi:hypothetical protein
MSMVSPRFLDLVASLASVPSAHLLDSSYAAMFSEGELVFGQALELPSKHNSPEVPDAVRQAFEEALAPFGVRPGTPTAPLG